jgi:class 3 adenylate cyclase
VRLGVATGEVEPRGEDYFGPTMNRAARVMAAGHDGQILVAASTASLVSGVELIDFGRARAAEPVRCEQIYQIRAEGLAVEFETLRTVDVTPGNLPVKLRVLLGVRSK